MAPAVVSIKINFIWSANLNLTKMFKIKKNNNDTMGYMAGYILNASKNSPCNNRCAERCIPQPGHSTPKNFLLRQGSI